MEQVAIPVRKSADTATLLAAINQALAELDADGTLSGAVGQVFRDGYFQDVLTFAKNHREQPISDCSRLFSPNGQ